MRSLLAVLVPLALLGSGCALPVGAQERVEDGVPALITLPDFVGKDGLESAKRLVEMGYTFKLHGTPRGEAGQVTNQMPTAGTQLHLGEQVDLIISGDSRLMAELTEQAKPQEPAVSVEAETEEAENLDKIRARLDHAYDLDRSLIEQHYVPAIEGRANAPKPKLPGEEPNPGQGGVQALTHEPGSGQPADGEAATGRVEGTLPGDRDVTLSQTDTPGGQPPQTPYVLDPVHPLDGPAQVVVGPWKLTLPGPSTTYATEVDGIAVAGAATRDAAGHTIAMGCAALTGANGQSLAAGMVDQLLLAAPYRYGTPQRAGRYTMASMPAVSTVYGVGQSQQRVITWYGYGYLCDLTVPVDADGRSEGSLQPIVSSITHTTPQA